MKEIVVPSSSHTYSVWIGEGLLKNVSKYLQKEYSSIFVITDDVVEKLYLQTLLESLPKVHKAVAVVAAGEQSKNITTYYRLQTEAIEAGLDRNSLIIALGGGVVGDIAGFVAATYMRGIDYIQVPTTVLAHDSSVGGKVAINHEQGKNLIGSFYPPAAVLYDVDTLATVPPQEIRSGYAEIVKEALISDKEAFERLLQVNLHDLTKEELQEHLSFGIEVKTAIVTADEKEKGERKFLNLGHTLGHAIETELQYQLLKHGEAVAVGLLFSLFVSEDLFQADVSFSKLYGWLSDNGYPLPAEMLDPEILLKRMKTDKKAQAGKVQMVLLKDIGQPTTAVLDDEQIVHYIKRFRERLVRG